MVKKTLFGFLFLLANLPSLLLAQDGVMEKIPFSIPNQISWIAFLSIVTLLPFAVMMLTSFTRISIIFQFLRHALGTMQIPSNQIIIGLSLILTGFVMHPVIEEINQKAITPYVNQEYKKLPEVASGSKTEESILLAGVWDPIRQFLLKHAREKDLELFLDIAKVKIPQGVSIQETYDAIPWYCLIPAFVLSELRTAFMMGFLLFLPFLIIDMVVSSVLMSLGMIMLPPIMVSIPFKLLLFIMIDGWHLIIQQVVYGFKTVG